MKYMVAFVAFLAVAQSAQLPNPFGRRPAAPSPFRSAPAPARPAPALERLAPAPVRSAPAPPRGSSADASANIVRYDSDVNPDGSYTYAFETDNGIAVQEQGTPRDFGGNPPLVPVVAQGNFAFTAPGGEPISISYIADENGYQPQGDVLPTPPPVPAQIARALEYLARTAPRQ